MTHTVRYHRFKLITKATGIIGTVLTHMGAGKRKLILIVVLVNEAPMKAMVDTDSEFSVTTTASINKLKVYSKRYNGSHTISADNRKIELSGLMTG